MRDKLALLAIVLLLGGCTARNAETRDAQMVVCGWIAGPDGFNPLTSINSSATMVENQIFTPLIDIGPNLLPSYSTSLATGIKIEDAGRRYLLSLRDTARWSDGRPVTADDVVFSIRANANPNVTQGNSAAFSLMRSVRQVNRSTVEVRLSSASPPFLSNALGIVLPLPAHILRKFPAESPQEAAYLNSETEFARAPVVDGPFRIKRHVADSYLILEPNPSYWGPRAAISQIAFRVYPQQDSLYAAVDAGEVDVTDIPPNLWRIHGRLRGKHHFVTWPWNVAFMLLPNFADPDLAFFRERPVRQAFMYALNRNFIVHGLMNGQADILNGPFPNFSPYYNSHTQKYPYDPKRAARLLDAAGWHMKGTVRWKHGKQLRFVLKTGGATDAVAANIAELIQANLKAVGVDCELENEEIATFFSDLHNLRFSVALRGRILTTYPDDYSSIDSKQTRKHGGYNLGTYKNLSVDDAIERARSASSPAIAREQLDRYQELAAVDLPVIYLYSNRLAAVVPATLSGYELSPNSKAALPEGLQRWRLR